MLIDRTTRRFMRRPTPRRSAFAVLFVSLLLLTPQEPRAANAIVAKDDAGNTVRLNTAAKRVISLAPHVTELMFAAGAGDKLVGVVEYSDYPSDAVSVARIGDATNIDFERIVELQPDLIIGWQTGNPSRLIEKLKSLSFQVYLSEPTDFENVASTIENIGQMTGDVDTARPVASDLRRDVQALAAKYDGATTVSVFHPIWSDPLMTLGRKHIFSKVLQLCGGQNIFDQLDTVSAEIDIEAVLNADPDIILGGDRKVTDAARNKLKKQWRSWPTLTAVKNDHVFLMQSDLIHRPTPRLLDGATELCEILEQVRNQAGASTG